MIQLFIKGGLVMWPILALSIVTLSVVLERIFFLIAESRSRDQEAVRRIFRSIEQGQIEHAALAIDGSTDMVVRVLSHGLEHRDTSLTEAMLESASAELDRYNRGIVVLDTAVTLGPLLGLLGTVLGMMQVFGIIGGGEEATLSSAASLGTITADTTYTLTVALGNPEGANPGAGGPLDFDPMEDVPMGGAYLALLADGQPFAIDPIPAGLVAGGTWQDFSFSYTTTDSDPIVGEQLTIQLGTEIGSGEEEGASFDNVRLNASDDDSNSGTGGDGDTGSGLGTAPEPPGWRLLALGGVALAWLIRWKRLNSAFAS